MGRRSKEGCVFPMVIFSEFRTGSGSSMIVIFHVPLLAIMPKTLNLAYAWVTDDNHHEHAPHFISVYFIFIVSACSRISLHDHGCWKQMFFEKTTN